MTDERPNREFMEMLLEQDPLPEESKYSQHRQQINERMRKAVRDEKIVRVVTIALWAGAFAFPLFGFAVQQWIPRDMANQAGFIGDVLNPATVVAMLICGPLAIPMLIVYVLRYRRAVDRARDDARDAVLLDLQAKIAELSKDR